MAKLGYWLQEIRAPFLTLSVVLIFLGTSVAVVEGSFFLWRADLRWWDSFWFISV